MVLRERLLDTLRLRLDVPLTLVDALAVRETPWSGTGSGRLAAAWPSLDHADEDPSRFWRYFHLLLRDISSPAVWLLAGVSACQRA